MPQPQNSDNPNQSKSNSDLAPEPPSSKLFQIKLWLRRRILIIDLVSFKKWLSCKNFIFEIILSQVLTQQQNPHHRNYSESSYASAAKSSVSKFFYVKVRVSRKVFIIGIILKPILTQLQKDPHADYSKSTAHSAAKSSSSKLFYIKLRLGCRIFIIKFILNLWLSWRNLLLEIRQSHILTKPQNPHLRNYSTSKYDLAAKTLAFKYFSSQVLSKP